MLIRITISKQNQIVLIEIILQRKMSKSYNIKKEERKNVILERIN